MLRENPLDYKDKLGGTRQPRLRFPSDDDTLIDFVNAKEFEVVIEDKIISNAGDFITAFAILMAAHYVFNVNYAKEIQHTMIFVQKILLNMTDNFKTPPKVLSLMTKLRKKYYIFEIFLINIFIFFF